MFLAIDTGNSDIKGGLFDGDKLVHFWRMPTPDFASFFVPFTKPFTGAAGASDSSEATQRALDRVSAVYVSSVVPGVNHGLAQLIENTLALEPVFIHAGMPGTGITFGGVDPSELGADLFANAVAARSLFRGEDCLSVDLGTASTFCAINGDGLYRGTTIVPGMRLALEALTAGAAMLPDIPLAPTDNIINTDTVACLQSGIYYGYSALVDGLVEKIKAEQGPRRVILTGGIGAVLAPHLQTIDNHISDLTLQGLRFIHGQYHYQD